MLIYPVIVIVGTCLNCMSILVFRQPSLKKTTTAFILTTLAVADTISLYVSALEKSLRASTGLSSSASSDISCKLYGYISYTITCTPGWLLVILTGERFINMVNPHHARQICTTSNASILLVCVFVCLCICYVPVVLYDDLGYNIISSNNDSTIFVEYSCSVLHYSSFIWIHMVVHCILPFMLMICCSIVIISLIYKTIKKRDTFRRNNNESSEHDYLISLAILLIFANQGPRRRPPGLLISLGHLHEMIPLPCCKLSLFFRGPGGDKLG